MTNSCSIIPAVCEKLTTTERYTCGRCGGDGKYPSSCWNGVCLGCNGRGFILTKRGAATERYLRNLRSLPVEQLAVGMVIQGRFGMAGSIIGFGRITKFERITAENAICTWEDQVTHQRKHLDGFEVVIENAKLGSLSQSIGSGELVRIAQTNEQKRATLAQALEYQDTLTKTGTVRKVRAKAGSVAGLPPVLPLSDQSDNL